MIFVGQAQADLGREATIGSLAILASAICYALNIILMRRQALAAGPTEIAFFQSADGDRSSSRALSRSSACRCRPRPNGRGSCSPRVLAITSLLILSWAYARAEASYLAATEYTAFLWAALFGWLVFHEPLSPFTLGGAAMIVAGCILAARRPAARQPEPRGRRLVPSPAR